MNLFHAVAFLTAILRSVAGSALPELAQDRISAQAECLATLSTLETSHEI